MKKRPQAQRRSQWPHDDETQQRPRAKRNLFIEYGPAVFGGVILMGAFAFAGHYLGRSAVAHTAVIEEMPLLPAPISVIATKGSLLPDDESFDIVNMKLMRKQMVMSDGKGDLELPTAMEEPPPPMDHASLMDKAKAEARLTQPKIKIEPAAVNLRETDKPSAVKRLALTPKPSKIEKDFTLSKKEKQKVIAQRRIRLAEENCLARAVYFEARSESELGQMAVAKVVLNRTRMDGFPKTICGVVYQGSNRRNSCQFSFACDGLPDDVKQPASWAQAKRIAKKAMSGHQLVGGMGNAVNYHADYVKPKWSKTMRRLVKIGRHIFYADG